MTELVVAGPIELHVWILAFAVTAVAALLQATIGLGFALLAVPVLSFLDPRLAPVPQLFLVLPLALLVAAREREAMRPGRVAWVILGRLPGAALGTAIASIATPRLLDGIVGGVVLAMAAILGSTLRLPRGRVADAAIGGLSAFSEAVSSIGGPPLALLFRGEAGPVVRANLSLIFAAGVMITLAARLIAGQVSVRDLEYALVMLPGMALGLWASRSLIPRVDGAVLRAALVVVALVAGAAVLGRALFA